jgi:hypothetical protein
LVLIVGLKNYFSAHASKIRNTSFLEKKKAAFSDSLFFFPQIYRDKEKLASLMP